ncbi:MAG: hypothetical protein LBF00_00865 [Mycoplasmataceae bacterium]|jgi:uncharacterized membrane protein YbhN (UPF0104 family)|nr:hypothetical protein [Mycoplasmataceae bacterium]
MLHTLLTAAQTQTTNWFLIVGLTIIIALPFIASSIIIPILIAIHRRKTKKPTRSKTKKHKGGKYEKNKGF